MIGDWFQPSDRGDALEADLIVVCFRSEPVGPPFDGVGHESEALLSRHRHPVSIEELGSEFPRPGEYIQLGRRVSADRQTPDPFRMVLDQTDRPSSGSVGPDVDRGDGHGDGMNRHWKKIKNIE